MYLLDTNVVSELRLATSGRANQGLLQWVEREPLDCLFLSSISILELEVGVLRVERRDTKQGTTLRGWLDQQVKPAFAQRILGFDNAAAVYCAQMHVPDPKAERDSYIAAIATAHKLPVVTRNTADFESMGVTLINQWQ